jgi:hypothetical protein
MSAFLFMTASVLALQTGGSKDGQQDQPPIRTVLSKFCGESEFLFLAPEIDDLGIEGGKIYQFRISSLRKENGRKAPVTDIYQCDPAERLINLPLTKLVIEKAWPEFSGEKIYSKKIPRIWVVKGGIQLVTILGPGRLQIENKSDTDIMEPGDAWLSYSRFPCYY